MMRAVIYGHSFVRRLREDIENGVVGELNFGLGDYEVEFRGEGGLTVHKIMKRGGPPDFRGVSVVYLQIGGNDIRKKKGTVTVFESIKGLVERLLATSEARIVVGPLFGRRTPKFCSPEYYESTRMEVNRLLRMEYDGDSRVLFWRIKKCFRFERDFGRDGVHLNDSGMLKYYHEVKKAIVLWGVERK
jgi:hypothetical protein